MPSFISNTILVHIAAYQHESDSYLHLVLKRSNHLNVYPGIWQVITGRIEAKEKAVDAAIREVEEETGIISDKIWTLPYVATFFNPYLDSVASSPCFGLITGENTEVRISSEHVEYEWLSIDECIKRVVLPSHKEGSRIFHEFILNNSLRDIFSYKRKK